MRILEPMRFTIRSWVIGLVLALLSACAGHQGYQKSAQQGSDALQIQMSVPLRLEPLAQDQRKVFIQIRQLSDQTGSALQTSLSQALQAKGYAIVDQLSEADYWLEAQILSWGFCGQQALAQALHLGFDSSCEAERLCRPVDLKHAD